MFIIRSTKPCSIAKYTAYIIIHNFTILTIPFIIALPIIDFLFYYIIPNTLHVPTTTAYAIPLKHITLKLTNIIFKLTLTNFITYWFYLFIFILTIPKYTKDILLLQISLHISLSTYYPKNNHH